MKINSKMFLVPVVALGVMLSGCGGGSDEPQPSPLPATVTLSAATNAGYNGVYSSSALQLAEVEKQDPIGGTPETCSFRFSGLAGPNGQLMDGDIRYLPANFSLHVMFVSINGVEFLSRETTNVVVDRANTRVNLNGKVLTASSGAASTITLTGAIPMLPPKPEGC